MKIGNIEIKNYAALAPMAGVADRAMREICLSYGAGYTVGELTSAKGISMGDSKSKTLISGCKEGISVPQIFGSEPETLAEGAVFAEENGADIIDINMGCPAPKVASNGGGSALLNKPETVGKIVKAVVNTVSIPVTVKIRAGWDENSLNAVKIASIAEENGAKAVTVHGRTRAQMYSPPVNRDIIRDVKKALTVPVIANGDIVDGKSAKEMYEYTGCDYCMVGRAAMGNPFVFSEINAYFENKPYSVSFEEKMETFKKQVLLMLEYKSERTAFLEARKHAAWYIKGFKNAANLRKLCSEINSYQDVLLIAEKALEMQKNI